MVSAHPSSFQDADNFVSIINGKLARVYNYTEDYSLLVQSKLYEELAKQKLLITHQEENELLPSVKNEFPIAQLIITPEYLKTISYPHQWCFSQLQDAALLTLNICKKALQKNMILKDASAFNIQFKNSKAIFIDTGSFTAYHEEEPWQAYGQFCRHFIAPLLLMKHVDISLNKLFIEYIDGVPLNLCSKLLPYKTKWNVFINTQIHWHAKLENNQAEKTNIDIKKIKVSKTKLINILNYLENHIKALSIDKKTQTQWLSYYENNNNYNDISAKDKSEFISKHIHQKQVETAIDFGCNTGVYSKLLVPHCKQLICLDIDPLAINQLYEEQKSNSSSNITVLVENIRNLSPSIGWESNERVNLITNTVFNMGMALALTHHLAITYNINFKKQAAFFAKHLNQLIIEFIEPQDSQIAKLIVSKKLVSFYSRENFEDEFLKFFKLVEKKILHNSNRILYYYVKN